MKIYLILLSLTGLVFSLNAQDTLYTPVKLELTEQYASSEELYSDSIKMFISTISNAYLYRSDHSYFIAYWKDGVLQEFKMPALLDFLTISLEFIDHNHKSDSLLIIKIHHYASNTYSSGGQWFVNGSRWVIINIENNSIVFDFDVKASYY